MQHDVQPQVSESVRQLAVVWRMTALDRDPGADVHDIPGIAVRWADCRFAFWNAITLTDAVADRADLASRLGRAVEIMRSKAHPGFLWLFDDLLAASARDALAETVSGAGLSLAFTGVGMSAPDVSVVADPHHPELVFERVQTDEHLRAYADLNAAGYAMNADDVQDGLGWWARASGHATCTPTLGCERASRFAARALSPLTAACS